MTKMHNRRFLLGCLAFSLWGRRNPDSKQSASGVQGLIDHTRAHSESQES